MSHAEVAREYYATLNRMLDAYWADPAVPLGDAPGVEEVFAHLDPEAERDWLFSPETPRGRDQLLRAASDWIDTVDAWKVEVDDLVDGTDGRVVVVARVLARGRGSGVPVNQRLFSVLTIRGGRVVRIDDSTDREQALQAAGLRE